LNGTGCPIVDTHAHLADAEFDRDRDEVVDRAKEAGVVAIVTVGETLDDAVRTLQLASRHPMLKPAAGLYPTQLDLDQADEMISWIHKEQKRLVAIGEVGLDHWAVKEPSQREIQREIFGRLIRLAQKLDLPLNVHSRSAGKAAIQHLLESGAQKVQLHAFDGKWASAATAAEAGYYFSIPPSVVRSRQKQKLVKHLPLRSILVETDSPVLGPSPNDRNEPANIAVVFEAVARIKGIRPEEAMEIVYENTVQLYGNLRAPSGPARSVET
jgi:TatD DNase family protein